MFGVFYLYFCIFECLSDGRLIIFHFMFVLALQDKLEHAVYYIDEPWCWKILVFVIRTYEITTKYYVPT